MPAQRLFAGGLRGIAGFYKVYLAGDRAGGKRMEIRAPLDICGQAP